MLVEFIHSTTAAIGGRPWLAAVAAMTVVAGIALQSVVRRRRHRRLADGAQQITITPPAQVDPAGAAAWWANLHELLAPAPGRRIVWGGSHIAVEYRWTGRQLTIVVWLPGTVAAAPIAAAVRAAWPGAATTVTDATPPVPNTRHVAGGTLSPALPAWYPLTVDHKTDPTRALIAALGGLRTGEHACIQVLTRPATARQTVKLRHAAATLRTGADSGRPSGGLLDPTALLRGILDLITDIVTELVTPGPPRRIHTKSGRTGVTDPIRDRDARPGLDKSLRPHWETAIRFAVTTDRSGGPNVTGRRLAIVAHSIASAFGIYTGRNGLRRHRLSDPATVLAGRRLSRGFLLSVDELAAVAGLPVDVAVPGLDRARARAVPAPVAVPTGGHGTKVLGRAEVGDHAVAVPIVDARQHIHVLGSTGSGKSTQLCHMIMDDIRNRRGVVLIDPKGDLALDVLDRIPAKLADKVVLIDPDQPGGATLNPLAGFDHDLVVDNIVAIFSKIFQRHWGPRIDDVLRVACLTLMRKANATLTLVPPLLNDKQFRARFTVDLDDPEGLRGFWEWYESTPPPLRAQVIGPVLARLRAFLLRDFVRQTLGVPKSSFDMGRILDGGILIARLPKGQLGEETAKLMGSFVFASVWQAATARARLHESERRDSVCYIDEAHNVLNLAGSVSDMLAEARGYHLSLVLAHQNLSQLPRDTQLALSANARNKLFFACSPEDAHQLARHTEPELDPHDLAHLDAYTAAARLVVGSRQTAAFTMRTRPPLPVVGEALALRQAVSRTGPHRPTGIEQLARRRTGKRHSRQDP